MARGPAGPILWSNSMMKLTGLVIASILLAAAQAAQAQPAAAPCAVVCFPPAVLNAKKCSCESAVVRKPVCSLVCLDPDQTLDAQRCACVRRPR
jgi:hypothetical protein